MKQMIKRALCKVNRKYVYQYRSLAQAPNKDYTLNRNNAENNEGNSCNYAKSLIGIGVAALVVYEFNGILQIEPEVEEFVRIRHVISRRYPGSELGCWVGKKLRTVIEQDQRKRKVLLEAQTVAGDIRDGLPTYSMEEVSKHTSKEDGIWITYKQGIYDITNFVPNHPGGDQIMMAAGNSADPFWLLYGVHKSPNIMALLETMRIGNLSAEDAPKTVKDVSDPYTDEPSRHRALKATSQKPFNAEPPPYILVENFLTPNQLFYVRNHLPVPAVDTKTYELEIEIEGKKGTKVLTLDDIKAFPKHQLAATVMCAGNRRSEMTKVKPVKGLDWGHAATGNAVWAGARLRDVLQLMGIDEDTEGYNHVQFEGLDTDTTNTPYGASIPFGKAVDKKGDVLLAYEMNGEPLSRDHGFPIRVIVPGVVGARNVKWLGRIIVSTKESDSHWQHKDYKGFSPSVDWDTVDWDKAPAIQELPVISAICKPSEGDCVKVEDGHILVQGYAWSGGGRQIVRIDVTSDEGNTWHVADIEFQDDSPSPQHWAWTLWSIRLPVKAGSKQVEVWAKAVDSSYNTQPESFKNIWNLRGVLNNAYHRVTVNLKW